MVVSNQSVGQSRHSHSTNHHILPCTKHEFCLLSKLPQAYGFGQNIARQFNMKSEQVAPVSILRTICCSSLNYRQTNLHVHSLAGWLLHGRRACWLRAGAVIIGI